MTRSICTKCEVLVSSARYGNSKDMDYCGCQHRGYGNESEGFDIERWVELTRDEVQA